MSFGKRMVTGLYQIDWCVAKCEHDLLTWHYRLKHYKYVGSNRMTNFYFWWNSGWLKRNLKIL